MTIKQPIVVDAVFPLELKVSAPRTALAKKSSRVNDNRKRARMRALEPGTCDNCFFNEIFWGFADMLSDLENICYRCTKRDLWQVHPKTGRPVKTLRNVKKRNMWRRAT